MDETVNLGTERSSCSKREGEGRWCQVTAGSELDIRLAAASAGQQEQIGLCLDSDADTKETEGHAWEARGFITTRTVVTSDPCIYYVAVANGLDAPSVRQQ